MVSMLKVSEVIKEINDNNDRNYPQIGEYWDIVYGQKVLVKVFKPVSSNDEHVVIPKCSILSKIKRDLLGE